MSVSTPSVMHFSTFLRFPALALLLPTSIAGAGLARDNTVDCGPAKRIALAQQAVAAINKPTAAQSAAAFEAFPFTADAYIVL